MDTHERWIDWLAASKRRAQQIEQLAPLASRKRKLESSFVLMPSSPDWMEQSRYPVQDPPNIIKGTRWFKRQPVAGEIKDKAA